MSLLCKIFGHKVTNLNLVKNGNLVGYVCKRCFKKIYFNKIEESKKNEK